MSIPIKWSAYHALSSATLLNPYPQVLPVLTIRDRFTNRYQARLMHTRVGGALKSQPDLQALTLALALGIQGVGNINRRFKAE